MTLLIRGIWMVAMVLGVPGLVAGRPITLAPVGVPMPGNAPVALAVADTRGGTFVFVGDADVDQIRVTSLDDRTGSLAPVAVVPLAASPSALATTVDSRFLLVATTGNELISYGIDPTSGPLTFAGSTTTGGRGPAGLDVSKKGFVVVANKESDTVGVVEIDSRTGTLSPVGAVPVCDAPNDVKVRGRNVVVGCTISYDVHLLQLDQRGALDPLDVEPLGSPVTGLTALGRDVVAGTADGRVHYYRIRSDQLVARGTFDTGGEVTDVALVQGGPLDWTLFVGGRNRMAALMRTNDGIAELGELALEPAANPRDLVALVGKQKTTFVLANETENDLTRVVAARRARKNDGSTSSTSSTTSTSSSSSSIGSPSTTSSTLQPGGVRLVPVDAPEGLAVVLPPFFGFGVLGEERLTVLLVGLNGWAILDAYTGEVLVADYVGPFQNVIFIGHPLGAYAAAVETAGDLGEPDLQAVVQAGLSPNGPAITGWESGEFGFTQVTPGSICFDSWPYGGDQLSGGAVAACGFGLRTLEPDEGLTSFNGGTGYSGFPQPGGILTSAFRRRAGGPIVAATEGTPGTIWKHPATGTPGEMPQVVEPSGDKPRRLRCAGDVCALSNFGSDSLTVLTWDAQDAVSVVGTVPVGDGPVGIDVRPRGDGNVEVVSTGLNDDSYSVTVLRSDGSTASNEKRAVPTGCAGPGHAVWGRGSEIVISCNESDAIAVVPAP